jgi:hypothetical protein
MSMRIILIEPFSGISGDMFVGALLDLGVELPIIEQQLRRLPVAGYTLSSFKCSRAGIQATKFDVQIEGHREELEHSHRSFRDIRRMIETSGLSEWVRERSIEAFTRLADAEGRVHGIPSEEVKFHEVGAVDSIVDIVGTMIAAEQFLPARFISFPVNVGHGTLKCRHGIYPVPGPATRELLQNVPTYCNEVEGELATPTGAALLIALAADFVERPLMLVRASGYGAGSRETPGNANVLRISRADEVPRLQPVSPEEQVAVVEATLDDMNPQIYGYFQEKALQSGALDVYAAPVQMKKNRPGLLLTVVCSLSTVDAIAELIFAETTTIGVRYTVARRKTLERRFVEVQTRYGAVKIKVSHRKGRPVNFAPEYEDCRRLAAEKGIALKEVLAAAMQAYLSSDPRP